MGKIYITREDYKAQVGELEAKVAELEDTPEPEATDDWHSCLCPTCAEIRKQREPGSETIEEILALAGR